MWKLVSVCLETVLILTQDWYGLRRTYHRLKNWTHPMVLQGDVGHVESRFDILETVLVSVQDQCMVCAKRTIGSETLLDVADGIPR
jgi:hypothetical protein